MLYGGLKPRIILPRIYEPQQLNMIFTHELIHYKHHDLIWKHLANIICCIYWFQPALKDVFYQLDQWGETYCDRTVCEYLPDVKGYFFYDHRYFYGRDQIRKIYNSGVI